MLMRFYPSHSMVSSTKKWLAVKSSSLFTIQQMATLKFHKSLKTHSKFSKNFKKIPKILCQWMNLGNRQATEVHQRTDEKARWKKVASTTTRQRYTGSSSAVRRRDPCHLLEQIVQW